MEGQRSKITPEEAALVLGQSSYLLLDDGVFRSFKAFPEYILLLPALSHLNRTSNLSFTEAEVLKRRIKLIADIILFTKNEADIDLKEVAFIKSLLVYASCVMQDAVGGWRGKLLTERISTYRVETPTERRKGFWEKLFGR
jgi:hypothetical protein